MSADTAPAAMPGVEEVARLVDAYAFKSWQQAHDYEIKTTGDAEEAVRFADWSVGKRVDEAREKARAILDLFVPILAEKERLGKVEGLQMAVNVIFAQIVGSDPRYTLGMSKSIDLVMALKHSLPGGRDE